jgi:hypothetical protein
MAVVARVEPAWVETPAPPIVAAANGADAAARVGRLLDDRSQLAEIRDASRSWAVDHRSISEVTRQLLEQYRAFGVAT